MALRRSRLIIYIVLLVVSLVSIKFLRRTAEKPSPHPPLRTLPKHVDLSVDVPKRNAIVKAFKHAWHAYERDAFGSDEYHPVTKTGTNLSHTGGVGYAIIDALDTMVLFGLKDEYARSREWIAEHLSFERDDRFNTFETTIRILGGLLSAYHLSGETDSLYLQKAVDLADRMLPAFDTPSGLPETMVNLAKSEGVKDMDNRGLVSTAEVGTLQLEFKYLSHVSGDKVYWQKVEKVMKVIKDELNMPLVPIFMNPQDGRFQVSDIRLGSRGDSYYEYLLKQYLQTGRTETVYRSMYDDAMDDIHRRLIAHSTRDNLTYTVELVPTRAHGEGVAWKTQHKQDHLVCFLGGLLLLGVTDGSPAPQDPSKFSARDWKQWEMGTGLIRGCMDTHQTLTGLSPEIAFWKTPETDLNHVRGHRDWYIKQSSSGSPLLDARYILRPETVESLFYAFRLTGDPQYRQWGWEIFQSIEKWCKVPSGGYQGVRDVDPPDGNVEGDDKMETFFLGETLKYLYLLFDDPVLDLRDVVFNTEAHILPVFEPTIRTGFV